MRSSILIAVIVAVLAAAWIGSGVLFDAGADETRPEISEANQEQADEKLQDVRVRELQAEIFVNDVTVTGRSQASRTVELRAETAGQIEAVLYEEGAEVAKGTELARIEVRDRDVRVQEAQKLVEQRTIEYRAAKSLEDQGFNSRIRLAEAQAALETAKAFLRQAEIDLEKTGIKAPIDGVISRQHIEAGDYVSVGTGLFSIVKLDPVEIIGFVTERYIADIEEGQRAKATLLDGKTFEGTISFIAPAADPQTRTFRVIATMENGTHHILEGMTAELRIPLQQKDAHRISPSILTLNDAGQVGVRTVDGNNIVKFMPVRILADQPGEMLVDGLPERVRVITVGQEFVIDGEKVKPVPAEGSGLL